MYHVMGSRILSRSFNVEKWTPDGEEEEDDGGAADVSMGSGMDVDLPDGASAPPTHSPLGTDDLEHEEGEEQEQEDSSDITMVPMADILNARYRSENVRPSPFNERSPFLILEN
jgi:SET domain-containing protein 6